MTGQPPTDFVLASTGRYVPAGKEAALLELPIARSSSTYRPGLRRIPLPDWARDLGVGDDGALLAPVYCLAAAGEGEDWERCDWWQACFSFLTCEAERDHEARNGPVHSYAFRLPQEIAPLWDHAWVNRILLFLRRWAARHAGTSEDALFGSLPVAEILLTHDVDALEKTLPIRIKALAFDLINAARLTAQGKIGAALARAIKGASFVLRPADYNYLDHIAALEKRHGRRSTFNVHGGKARGKLRGPKRYLMDPGYDIQRDRFANQFRRLAEDGFTMGVHPSFDVFSDSARLRAEMDRISEAVGRPVTDIRQHWLRFSWGETWLSQEQAGLTLDTTLGFNDRPAFRNGAALQMPAWIGAENRMSSTLQSLPLLLMDSHLFDYHLSDEATRRATIDRWIDEVKAVHGIATIVWHQRVFHPKDYGWGDDYEYLLSRLPREKGRRDHA